MREEHKLKAVLQIFILVLATVAFAYIVDDNLNGFSEVAVQKNKLLNVLPPILRIIGEMLFSDLKSVSAFDVSDLNVGAITCVKAKDGSICQMWPASECNDKCEEACIPSDRSSVAECKPGTCFDPVEGSCQAGSPKVNCEENQGVWIDDPLENVAQCREGCCVLGDQTSFVTQRQCLRQGNVLGVDEEFKPEIRTELSCLVLARSQEEGACVTEVRVDGLPQTHCNFVTKKQCLESLGDFHSGWLCSNPELNTICVRQATAQCINGKDEVFWFDSCGNKENIYDANKVSSWNNGLVLSKADSCSLGDDLQNQKTCGNCNYLLGSRCSRREGTEKLADKGLDVVCRDLGCVDGDENARRNGESWCVYQGAVGPALNSTGDPDIRSRDAPGSLHIKQICLDGEIITEPCQDYRNGICEESRQTLPDGSDFASASCRLNRWQECISYNTEMGNDPEYAMEECIKNSDCFIKSVDIADNFKFKICVAKYPPGFDLDNYAEGARSVCATATQTCTMVDVKNWKGKWKCKVNCDCKDNKFAEQMNDLCMSLGDCGASVNYVGDYSPSYRVGGDFRPDLTPEYLGIVKGYDEVEEDVYIQGNFSEMIDAMGAVFGIPEGLGDAGDPTANIQKAMNGMAMTSGAIGTVLVMAASTGIGMTALGIVGATTTATTTTLIEFEGGLFLVEGSSSALAPWAGAVIGFAIGVAVVSLLISKFGIAGGLEEWMVYTLIIGGGVALGVAVFFAIKLGVESCAIGGPGGCIVGAIIFIIIVAITIFLKIFGVGKTRKKTVKFSCRPWQAPYGGDDCSKCGKKGLDEWQDSLLCNEYACKSLGQTCSFINQGSGNEMCVDISPHDVKSPMIGPWRNMTQNASSVLEYADVVSGQGFKVKSGESDGCIREYELMVYGIEIDEPAACRVDTVHTPRYEDMENDLTDGLFLYEHSMTMRAPALSELGISGFDPTRRGEVNLYVRCVDKNGNRNVNEQVVEFCVRPAEDVTPPVVQFRDPWFEWVEFNATELKAAIYTNEPADCKWGDINQDYDVMVNELECLNEFSAETMFGFMCNATFPVENNLIMNYIRCEDQPWFEGTEQEGDRNKNSNSYEFKISRTSDPLIIDYVTPDNETLVFGVEPASVAVEVRTAGGMGGKAECKYKIGNSWISFFDTFRTTHRQTFQNFMAGNKVLPIKCEDVAGNIAAKTIEFKIEIDVSAPIVTRVYNSGGSLIVVTDENSVCYYENEDCNFVPTNGTEMLGARLVHSIGMEGDKTYYVKCVDKFDNYLGDCNAVVKGGI